LRSEEEVRGGSKGTTHIRKRTPTTSTETGGKNSYCGHGRKRNQLCKGAEAAVYVSIAGGGVHRSAEVAVFVSMAGSRNNTTRSVVAVVLCDIAGIRGVTSTKKWRQWYGGMAGRAYMQVPGGTW
jgi:hypothetical protein